MLEGLIGNFWWENENFCQIFKNLKLSYTTQTKHSFHSLHSYQPSPSLTYPFLLLLPSKKSQAPTDKNRTVHNKID